MYGVGSLTKSMVSAGIGKLVEDGRLQWNTPVQQLLPSFSHQDPQFAKEVTIADFLSHRSGLSGGVALNLAFQGDGEMLLPADSLLEIFHHIPRVAAIGEAWMYFVWGYSIAGLVIEEVTRSPLHQYLQEEVFQPVSMNRTTLWPSFQDPNFSKAYASLSDGDAHELQQRQPFAETFFEASGGAYSTVNDLLRWSKVTLDACQDTDTPTRSILKQIPEILKPQATIDSKLLPGQSYGFGWLQAHLPGVVGLMGDNSDLWEISDLPILGDGSQRRAIIYHQGATVGYYSFLALFPETQSAVVVLTNAIAMSDVADWAGRVLIEALFDFPKRTNYVALSEEGKRRRLQQFEDMQASLAKEHAPDTRPLPLDAYVGKYANLTYESDLEVSLDPDDKDSLVVSFQYLRSQRYRLRHLRDNVFEWALGHDEGKRRGRYTVADASYSKFSFETSAGNQVDKLIWNLDEASQPGGVIFSRLDGLIAYLPTHPTTSMSSFTYINEKGAGEKHSDLGHYSQAVLLPGNIVKCSGQGGWTPTGDLDANDWKRQIDLAFDNVDRVLQAADLRGWEDVYLLRSYHVDIDASWEYTVEKLRARIPDHRPVWTAIAVPRLAFPAMKIELEVEAYDASKAST
ncbi:unnamed protein product [Penicillium olsonii]|nr:unnamed protein product [Penicillium olsonii]